MSRLHIVGSKMYHPNAVQFNGTDEYLNRTGTLGFASDTAGAWSMWIRISATFGADGAQFINSFGNSSNARILSMSVRRIATTGTGTFFSWTYTNSAIVTRAYSATTTALAANTWYHVVFQSNGTSWSVRINNVAQTITQWTGTALNSGDWYGDMGVGSPRWTIGVSNTTGGTLANYFSGRLNNFVYVGGRALTTGEITELYNGGVPRNPRRLSFAADVDIYLPMGDSRDSATTVFDEIGTNDLTLVNMDASNYVAP